MKFTLFFVFLITTQLLNAQTFQWAKSMGGSIQDIGYSSTTDGLGNVYTTGHFFGTVDFDPGGGTHNLTALGGIDVFIQKLDPNGNFIWAKQFKGNQSEVGRAIVVDNDYNIFVLGSFESQTDFDPGSGTFYLNPLWGSTDVFITKLDSGGNFIWAERFGGGDYDHGYGMTQDVFGDILITGYFEGSADLDPSSGGLSKTAIGGTDIYVIKIDTAGSFIWAATMGGFDNDIGNDVTTDLLGNVIVTGSFKGTCDFDPSGVNNSLISNDGWDVFIVKLDINGNYTWSKQIGGVGHDEGNAVKCDNNNNVIVAGKIYETVDFNPGLGVVQYSSPLGDDSYVLKLDQSGNYLWHSVIDQGQDLGYSLCVDNLGDIYSTGQSSFQIYIRKISTQGQIIWTAYMGAGGSGSGYSICQDLNGAIILCGEFGGTADFDPGQGIFNLSSNSGNMGDIFVMKLGSAVGIDEITQKIKSKIFPNPASVNVSIDVNEEIELVEIYDSMGKLIVNVSNINNKIEISPLSDGIYIVKIKTISGVIFEKLIKQ